MGTTKHKVALSNFSFGKFALSVLIASVTLVSCASQGSRISARQAETDNLRREIKFLKQENSQLRRELDDVKKQIQQQQVTGKQDEADLEARFDEILQQLNAVQSQLQDTNYRLNHFTSSGARPAPASSQNAGEQPLDSTGLDSQPADQSGGADRSRELYNTAYRDLIRGNYQLALQGFQQFTAQYRNSDLIDNAQYWIGEVYYAQGHYQEAIEEFEKCVRLYRNGEKTASALLKIGYSFLAMNELEQGKIYLEEVLRDYPDSEESSLARGRLASLK